jgi:hypothetical protein
MNTQLLCTFCDRNSLDDVIDSIFKKYTLVYRYIYVLYNPKNKSELFVTYNIDMDFHTGRHLPSTILLHRKKETNTLYTINALNDIIKQNNKGFLDKSYVIDWTKFRNSIILTSDDGARVIPTKVMKHINSNFRDEYIPPTN